MRPRPSFRSRLLPALLAAGLAASLAPSPAFANSYKRGDASCPDFQKYEKTYQSDPTGGDAVAYALCLLARGGEDVRALTILDAEIRKGRVDAARDKAVYETTGGTMEMTKLDDRKYNEALQAYGQVLFLINSKPDYPKGFRITEGVEQHELEAYYYLVRISYAKSLHGMEGIHNAHLLQSPTYKGTRDIKLYPKYNPYTLDSLDKTIEYAGRCANLPQKNYFQPLRYQQTIAYCRLMKDYSKQLRELEEDRLTLLNGKACARDIEQCSEYRDVVFNKIFPLKKIKEQEISKIWDAKSVSDLPRPR